MSSSSGRSPRVLSTCTAWSLSRVTAFSSTSWSHSFRSASWSLAAAWAKGGTQSTWGGCGGSSASLPGGEGRRHTHEEMCHGSHRLWGPSPSPLHWSVGETANEPQCEAAEPGGHIHHCSSCYKSKCSMRSKVTVRAQAASVAPSACPGPPSTGHRRQPWWGPGHTPAPWPQSGPGSAPRTSGSGPSRCWHSGAASPGPAAPSRAPGSAPFLPPETAAAGTWGVTTTAH